MHKIYPINYLYRSPSHSTATEIVKQRLEKYSIGNKHLGRLRLRWDDRVKDIKGSGVGKPMS